MNYILDWCPCFIGNKRKIESKDKIWWKKSHTKIGISVDNFFSKTNTILCSASRAKSVNIIHVGHYENTFMYMNFKLVLKLSCM